MSRPPYYSPPAVKPASPSTEAACKPWCGQVGLRGVAPTEHAFGWYDMAFCSFACRASFQEAHDEDRLLNQPQPIERCSCAESMRLRAALEAIALSLDDSWRDGASPGRCEIVKRIARRALALETEVCGFSFEKSRRGGTDVADGYHPGGPCKPGCGGARCIGGEEAVHNAGDVKHCYCTQFCADRAKSKAAEPSGKPGELPTCAACKGRNVARGRDTPLRCVSCEATSYDGITWFTPATPEPASRQGEPLSELAAAKSSLAWWENESTSWAKAHDELVAKLATAERERDEATANERERCASLCEAMIVVGRAWTDRQEAAATALASAAGAIRNGTPAPKGPTE